MPCNTPAEIGQHCLRLRRNPVSTRINKRIVLEISIITTTIIIIIIIPLLVTDEFCTDKPSGMYANPSDCAAFIQCSHGSGVATWCARGTKFDSESGQCRQQDEAKCVDGGDRKRRAGKDGSR